MANTETPKISKIDKKEKNNRNDDESKKNSIKVHPKLFVQAICWH